MFQLAFVDSKGRLFDHPDYQMVARMADFLVEPSDEEMIPLPEGATLTMLPGCAPIGMDDEANFVRVDEGDGITGPIYAVGALLPQGYTRTLLPGYHKRRTDTVLPLLGYTAVAFKNGQLYVAALQTDEPTKWDPCNYNSSNLETKVIAMQKRFNNNRIVKQLARCAMEYSCFTAQNIFYRRWEGGIPVSPACNANCLGCISLQTSECCPSPQQRINFNPTVDEIVELGVYHLKGATEGIISFGQGCEGEPSLASAQIVKAIEQIRNKVDAGTININTNAGNNEGIRSIVDAGLNTMRVSMISPTETIYDAYYRPNNYGITEVKDSITYAKNKGLYVSINLLALPGLTDTEAEVEAWVNFLQETEIDLVQFRNLNIDPDWLLGQIPRAKGEVLGVPSMINILKQELPNLAIGNFSRPKL